MPAKKSKKTTKSLTNAMHQVLGRLGAVDLLTDWTHD